MINEKEKPVHISIELIDGYQLKANFEDEDIPDLIMDEARPLGEGRGPNPARLLAASTAGCLCASLVFCLRKARVEVKGLKAWVEVTLSRNERGRLRIGGIKVKVSPQLDATGHGSVERCRELFEEFCVVTQSVRQGIPVEVEVD